MSDSHGTHDHDDLHPRADAVEYVRRLRESFLESHPTERVSLERISGRALAEPIESDVDRPQHSIATMDGFAFDANEDYPFSVGEEIFPEDEPPSIEAGQAVRIATGAPLPERANAVLKVEEATVEDRQLSGPMLEPGTYVYERGSNVSAGETLFERGEGLSPRDAIFLRDLGIEEVPVYERFSAALLATGTEIHEGTQSDLDGPMLAGLIESWGHDATLEGTVPDEYDRVRDRISELADDNDVVVTTGGTSVGEKDYVIRALDDLGEVLFHRVAIRPGKPLAAARLPEHDAVAFAVPGKPIGAYVITTLVARHFFAPTDRHPAPTWSATMTTDVGLGPAGFEYVVPVVLEDGEATPLGHVDSALPVYDETFDPSVLSSSTRATRADGAVITDEPLAMGETVDVLPFDAVEHP